MTGHRVLDGHSAWITGSTQGLGAALAVAIARAGSHVVLHGLEDHPSAQQTLAECRAAGVRAHLILGDLIDSQPAGLGRLADQALACEPDLDLLVNNAGGYFDTAFLDLDYATFDKTMRLNVYAPCFLTQYLARLWVTRQTAGRVLLIGSINGRLAEPAHVAYDASKGAVEMLVRSLCVELAPRGIRVNGLAPGLFETPLTSAALRQPGVRRWMQWHTPNGQVPTPDVAGEAAVFLLSNAARHIHGQMLLIDGGMSAWQQPDPPTSQDADFGSD